MCWPMFTNGASSARDTAACALHRVFARYKHVRRLTRLPEDRVISHGAIHFCQESMRVTLHYGAVKCDSGEVSDTTRPDWPRHRHLRVILDSQSKDDHRTTGP